MIKRFLIKIWTRESTDTQNNWPAESTYPLVDKFMLSIYCHHG